MLLSFEEGRVIGCLIEKQLTTPQQYPLTLNALMSACNQSSNRDPVVRYDEPTVEEAVARLKDTGMLRFVHPSHGRSVKRYAQLVGERFGLDDRRLSLLGVLLLRGPQTVGEMRIRTERMAAFEGIGAVEAEMHHMSSGDQPLVARLARRPGQKEERWEQRLAAVAEPGGAVAGGIDAGPASDRATSTGAVAPPISTVEPVTQGAPHESSLCLREQLLTLAGEVATLRAEVAALSDTLNRLHANPR